MSSSSVGKHSFVVEQCRARSVLDIGCIDHDARNAIRVDGHWLHGKIAKVARNVTGLDSLGEEAAQVSALGYDVVVADAESFDLGRTFDVVIAADIIEHLARPGALLRCVHNHLAESSTFVVTTPNPFALARFLQAGLRNAVAVNAEHVAWFDPLVMRELLVRHEFVPIKFRWLHDDTASGSNTSKALDLLAAPLLRRRPLLGRSFGVVARRR